MDTTTGQLYDTSKPDEAEALKALMALRGQDVVMLNGPEAAIHRVARDVQQAAGARDARRARRKQQAKSRQRNR